MEERRSARVGTVSGLALLTGGTAVAAVTGETQTIFSSTLLGLLAVVLGHALLTEIHRQAHRRSPGWAVQDTANSALLAVLAAVALTATVLPTITPPTRAVCLTLTIGYALSCVYFVRERRRAMTTPTT
ncbi:hypothetical protein ACIBSW_36710 [Actinoplanes sp. NPDC049668]|uniref:hypothetical protein n=1 Tax=unclassified Actinoplanes TaxID=2626549 RepID=UPI0033A93504